MKCLLSLIFCFLLFNSCSANRDEGNIIPPVTSPLSGEYIGFGVITDSFTHITAEPSENSQSLGFLRRGTPVQIIRRQIIRTREGFVSWVLIDGNPQGWLREDVMDIYSNEGQARTASESMPR